jgi:hypothetical protein
MGGRCKDLLTPALLRSRPSLLRKEDENCKALFARSEERAVERSDVG